MENFDKDSSSISYSVEDERGDRVDLVEFSHRNIQDYDFKVMDLFLISYLPKLMMLGDSILVMGLISKVLSVNLMLFQEELIKSKIYPFTMVNIFLQDTKRVYPNPYFTDGIIRIAKTYLKDENLNAALRETFICYS
jgi:hypothetical protein